MNAILHSALVAEQRDRLGLSGLAVRENASCFDELQFADEFRRILPPATLVKPGRPGAHVLRLLAFVVMIAAVSVIDAVAQPRPDTSVPVGMEERSIQVDGAPRYFLVQSVNVRPDAPIVVVLHGGGQSMREIFGPRSGASRVWREIAEEQGVVLLAPNGTNTRTGDAAGDNQNWADARGLNGDRGADVRFILATIDWALERYRADPHRVYVTGASNGGMMTYTLLMDAPERFAAGVAFIANLPAADAALHQPSRPTPLMIMNGTEDPLMPYGGGAVAYNRGTVRSSPATAAWWVDANRATQQSAEVLLPDGDPNDGCRIRGERHIALPGGAPVVHYTVEGGGHAAPTPDHPVRPSRLAARLLGPLCRDVESSRLAWDFMREYRR
jgi:polyhydroxybutyrate depolymerase